MLPTLSKPVALSFPCSSACWEWLSYLPVRILFPFCVTTTVLSESERTALNHSVHSGSNRSYSDRPWALALCLGWHRLSGGSTSFHLCHQVSCHSDKILKERKERQGCSGSLFQRCQPCRWLLSFWACGKAKNIMRGGKLLTEWKPEIKGRGRGGGGGRRQQEAAG